MKILYDFLDRKIRFTDERWQHIEDTHPEMRDQFEKIKETLSTPDIVIQSKTDLQVELFFKKYLNTPVSEKFLCVVVKFLSNDAFIITAYFTDTIKKGDILWQKR